MVAQCQDHRAVASKTRHLTAESREIMCVMQNLPRDNEIVVRVLQWDRLAKALDYLNRRSGFFRKLTNRTSANKRAWIRLDRCDFPTFAGERKGKNAITRTKIERPAGPGWDQVTDSRELHASMVAFCCRNGFIEISRASKLGHRGLAHAPADGIFPVFSSIRQRGAPSAV